MSLPRGLPRSSCARAVGGARILGAASFAATATGFFCGRKPPDGGRGAGLPVQPGRHLEIGEQKVSKSRPPSHSRKCCAIWHQAPET